MADASLVVLQFDLLGPDTLPLLLLLSGLGLAVAEALAPGAHFIVVGVALILAGLVGLVVGPLAGPIALGGMVLLFGMIALYGYRELDIYGTEDGRTSDSDSLTGRRGTVTERVTPSEGEIRFDSGGLNPYYSARSMDGEIPVGTEVMVIDPGGGNVVTVDAVDAVEDDIDRELRRERERGRDAAAPADEHSSTDEHDHSSTDEHEHGRERATEDG